MTLTTQLSKKTHLIQRLFWVISLNGRNEPRKALVLIKLIRYVETYPKWEVDTRELITRK